MFLRWSIGMVVGTAIVWASSPWFVRSYLPRQQNRVVGQNPGVATLPADAIYRWRSEGYATSWIGKHGMVGADPQWVSKPNASTTIALWGDSQAEGVCVPDSEKIAARISQIANVNVLPLGSSGDDVSNWLPQIPFAEIRLGANLHLFMIAELSDLKVSQADPTSRQRLGSTVNQWIAWVPDFVVHAARNVFLGEDRATLRKLRFGVGPVVDNEAIETNQNSNRLIDWNRSLSDIRQRTDQSVVLVYAPQLPLVIGDEVRFDDDDDRTFQEIQTLAPEHGIQVVDMRPLFREAARDGNWAHGFHNGRIGSGHLNAIGNRLIAEEVQRLLSGKSFSMPASGR